MSVLFQQLFQFVQKTQKKWIFFMGFAFWFGCVRSDKPFDVSKAETNGIQIFKQNCVLCHGADGKLGLNGAKDLASSQMRTQDRIALIQNGKSVMPAFGRSLSLGEIEAVAKFTTTLNSSFSE
ncbi:MAG: cytochrome c [Saprospiraceae bacterium]|nr:cytochrome c [Saprospiraceae bacterium]